VVLSDRLFQCLAPPYLSEPWLTAPRPARASDTVVRHDWPTRAAARVAICAYIEVWYHRQRLHSTLGYLSPVQFENRAQAVIAA
jgi:transposase InsO family protein